VIAYCKENAIAVFAYSPLGRGFITRKWKTPEDIPEGSFQRTVPRFQGENFYYNLKLVDQLDELAAAKGVKTTQLALAWITQLSPHVSRTTRPVHGR
jgi:pyridoxine 4-dehydrogenase